MQQWLDEAKAKGIEGLHHLPLPGVRPVGLRRPSPKPDNPHKVIASYAKDMEMVVFNGHVHTTEMYRRRRREIPDAGRRRRGTGSDPPGPAQVSRCPRNYPPDLYWKGEPPKEEYNYVLVDVEPGKKTKFTLNRFRPWSAEPFATVELFK